MDNWALIVFSIPPLLLLGLAALAVDWQLKELAAEREADAAEAERRKASRPSWLKISRKAHQVVYVLEPSSAFPAQPPRPIPTRNVVRKASVKQN